MDEVKGGAANSSLDLPEGFKMTELGPLPEEWEVVKLKGVVSLRAGSVSPADVPGARYIGLEHIDSGEIQIKRFGLASDTRSTKSIFRTGDVLYGKLRPYLDKAALANWDGVCSTDILVFIPKPSHDALFIVYLFHHPCVLNYAIATTTGVNHPRTSWKSLSQAVVPLPPLAEQKTIAHVLRTVQRAKEATVRVIQAARELKKSTVRHLFTYGPVPVKGAENVPLKETEIGPVPEHWEVVRLGSIFEIQQGKALSPKHRTGKSPCPFLRTANVFWGQIDLSVVDETDFTDEEIQRLRLLPGDLLVCEGGDIGRTAIWRGELQLCCYQNHLHRLRAKNGEIKPEFYMYWMQAAILLFGLYLGQGNKTTIPNLSKARLAGFSVPLPPLPEQREITRVLQAVDKKLQAEDARRQASEALFKTLLHNLMTGKVRVKGLSLPEREEVCISGGGMYKQKMNGLSAGIKMTELGPLPEEWDVVRLGNVANIKYGKANPKDYGNIPVVGSGGVFSGTSKPLVEHSTIVIGRKGTAGKVWLFLEPCYPSDTTFYLEWKEAIDVLFLFNYMVLNPLSGERAKTTLPSLQKPDLENFKIPLPPLPEQQKIAAVLSIVQETKEKTEQVINAAKELKKSLMKHLFTYGPVPVKGAENVPLKETEIGPVPERWEVVKLKRVVSLRAGSISPADVPGAKYIGLEHMDSGEIQIKRFGLASDTRSTKSIFRTGDVLYGKLGPYLDKAALANWDGVCSTDILVFIPKPPHDALFIVYLFHHPCVLDYAIATTTGVSRPRTSWKSLSQAVVPLPPLAEQREITRVLQAADKKLQAEDARRQALEALFKTLLHNLMTGKVRVKGLGLPEREEVM